MSATQKTTIPRILLALALAVGALTVKHQFSVGIKRDIEAKSYRISVKGSTFPDFKLGPIPILDERLVEAEDVVKATSITFFVAKDGVSTASGKPTVPDVSNTAWLVNHYLKTENVSFGDATLERPYSFQIEAEEFLKFDVLFKVKNKEFRVYFFPTKLFSSDKESVAFIKVDKNSNNQVTVKYHMFTRQKYPVKGFWMKEGQNDFYTSKTVWKVGLKAKAGRTLSLGEFSSAFTKGTSQLTTYVPDVEVLDKDLDPLSNPNFPLSVQAAQLPFWVKLTFKPFWFNGADCFPDFVGFNYHKTGKDVALGGQLFDYRFHEYLRASYGQLPTTKQGHSLLALDYNLRVRVGDNVMQEGKVRPHNVQFKYDVTSQANKQGQNGKWDYVRVETDETGCSQPAGGNCDLVLFFKGAPDTDYSLSRIPDAAQEAATTDNLDFSFTASLSGAGEALQDSRTLPRADNVVYRVSHSIDKITLI